MGGIIWGRDRRWAGHSALLALALAALVMPRLIAAAPLDLLKGMPAADPAEDAGENFPGSAFFFAQDAFNAPAPLIARGEHVTALDTVSAAPAMIFRGQTPLDGYRALNCLTSAIYYEAGNEPEDGQRAVAQVVLNRVRNRHWPKTVCGVVYEGSERTDFRCQFTFSCDGAMARMPNTAAWTRARHIAEQALGGSVYAPVGLATFYHTLAVRPAWAASKQVVAIVGAHIFYRQPGQDGAPDAFRLPYAGREFQSGPARRIWPVKSPFVNPATGLPLPVTQSSPLSGGPTAVSDPAPDQLTNPGLPQSTIRAEYRNSGRPLI